MDFQPDVISNVFDETKDTELKIVADQIRRDASVGTPVERLLTEAQYALGLGYGDTKRVEEMVEGLDKYAGLKSTLRKLRQQLNKHDNEDLEGMSKLITCIEGVEKQLEKKQKAKEDRQSKRKPAEPADDGEKEAEAAAPGAVPPGTPGDLPDDQSAPQDLLKPAPEVMEDPLQLAGKAIDFGMLKSKVAALQKEIAKMNDMESKSMEFETSIKPQLLNYMETLEDGRLLIEHAEKKWSLLRVQNAPTPASVNKEKLLGGIMERIAEGIKKGEKFAEQLAKSIKGMENSPAYQNPETQSAPYLKMAPTPKDLQLAPHNKVPPAPQKKSSLRATAGALDSLFAGLEEALQEIADLVDIAESKLQPAF